LRGYALRVATGLSEIDLRFRRSRRQAAARHRRPRRRHPLEWRSLYAALLALAVLAVAAESTPIEGSSAKAKPPAHPPATLSPACPVPAAFRVAFAKASAETGVPASLLVATAYEESRMNPSALSAAGARGLLQLMPSTAQEVGLRIEEPAANVLAGARYLRVLLDRFGDVELALAAYNAGPTAIERAGHASAESLRYAKNVEARAAVISC
jgi:soluble lytic murein transglycosylase-like protein